MKNCIDVFRVLSSSERKNFVYVIFLVVAMAILEVLGVASIMPFLSLLGDSNSLSDYALFTPFFEVLHYNGITERKDLLVTVGIASLFIIIFAAIYRIFVQFVLNRYVEARRRSISVRLMSAFLSREYEFFCSRHSGDLTKMILSEVDQFTHQALRPLIMLIVNVITAFFLLCLLFLIDFRIASLVLGVLLFLYTSIFLAVRFYIGEIGNGRLEANKLRFLLASECFGAIKNIKLDGSEQSYTEKFDKAAEHFSNSYSIQQSLSQSPRYIVEAFAIGSVFVLILFTLNTQQGIEINSLIPLLGLYVFAAYKLQPMASSIYQGVANIRYTRETVRLLLRDLQQHSPQIKSDSKFIGDIKLSKVSFKYKGHENWVLDNVSIEIGKGSFVGIAGGNGSGKSTLINLITGLLEPTYGKLLINGHSIHRNNARGWQNTLAYVPQEIFLSDATIAENIAFGSDLSSINMDAVKECAEKACIAEFIEMKLPDGYNTVIGERGGRLSGGQRQRIAIARALYKKPEVLVLDEATSALDKVTELKVIDSLLSMSVDITIIFVSHHLNILRKCDSIFHLKDGVIENAGTFDFLVNNDDDFYSMTQALR